MTSLNFTEVYADGADLAGITTLAANPAVKGFTTNPTLARQAGVTDYLAFARDVLAVIGDRPISLEVFADEPSEIVRQAKVLSALGSNVFVKMPVTTTDGTSTASLVSQLAAEGVQQNVTALMTAAQVQVVTAALGDEVPSFISVFAGRIADTGVDPLPVMSASLDAMAGSPNQRLIWASPREIFNIVQADEIRCHVITVTHAMIGKLGLLGKDLDEYSLETVKMFADDASAAGFEL